jgi:hypothetical protein
MATSHVHGRVRPVSHDGATSRPPATGPRAAADTRVGFDRRLFIDLIALLALLGTPTLLVVAALAQRPYILVGLALVIPALAAVPVALERRHGAAMRQGARRD